MGGYQSTLGNKGPPEASYRLFELMALKGQTEPKRLTSNTSKGMAMRLGPGGGTLQIDNKAKKFPAPRVSAHTPPPRPERHPQPSQLHSQQHEASSKNKTLDSDYA
jgi:hypothetical protein